MRFSGIRFGIMLQDRTDNEPDRPTTQTVKERPYPDNGREMIGQRFSTFGAGTIQTRYQTDDATEMGSVTGGGVRGF